MNSNGTNTILVIDDDVADPIEIEVSELLTCESERVYQLCVTESSTAYRRGPVHRQRRADDDEE